VFAVRRLTSVIHVCHCTYTCHRACNRERAEQDMSAPPPA
jgi:hypothetical protein